jgi:multidrug efflux system membrane fusion protein
MRPIKVARTDEQDAVIDSGLTGGETVVTDGQLRLVPGAAVTLKESVGQGGPKS